MLPYETPCNALQRPAIMHQNLRHAVINTPRSATTASIPFVAYSGATVAKSPVFPSKTPSARRSWSSGPSSRLQALPRPPLSCRHCISSAGKTAYVKSGSPSGLPTTSPPTSSPGTPPANANPLSRRKGGCLARWSKKLGDLRLDQLRPYDLTGFLEGMKGQGFRETLI